MSSDSSTTESVDTISITGQAIDAKQTNIVTAEGEYTIGDVSSPLEHMLGTLAACISVIGNLVGQEMGISISDLTITVEGDIDRRRYKGATADGRAGFHDIRVGVEIQADADEETLEEWMTTVDERCPISDNIQHETGATFSVQRK